MRINGSVIGSVVTSSQSSAVGMWDLRNVELANRQIIWPSAGSIITSGLILNLDAGNVASYPGSGTTWTDLSGNGNNGTLINGPTFNSSNGGSIVFDGTDDYVSASNSMFVHRTSNWTYSFWLKFSGTPSLGTIFENGSWTSCLLMRFQTDGISIYSMGSLWGKFTLSPTLGLWYKLDFIRNGSSLDFYLNSIYSQTMSFTADIQPSSNIFIGSSQHTTGQYFYGNISQVSIYNKSLSATEILQNFNVTRTRFGV